MFTRMCRSRPTTEECLEHRWLALQPALVKARKSASFLTDRLRAFEEDYIKRRMSGAAPSDALLRKYGGAVHFDDE